MAYRTAARKWVPNEHETNRLAVYAGNAGWSSPVARQAHNLKAAGSNPAPATNQPSKATSLA